MGTFLSLSEWKRKAADGLCTEPLYKYFVCEDIKAVDGVERALQFTISTESVDRDGDTIKAAGWDIGNYLANPVVLYGHDYHGLPVGKSLRTWVENGKLKSQPEFAPPDMYPFADTVYQMVKAGFLNATSVGFKPKDGEYTFDKDRNGVDFLKQELLEWSIVPVPSNPHALVEARSMGIDLAPLKAWAEQVLDTFHEEQGLWLPKSQVEQVFALLGTKTISIPSVSEDTIKAIAEHGLQLDIVGQVARLARPESSLLEEMKQKTEDLTVEVPLDEVVKAVAEEVVEVVEKSGRTLSAMHEAHLKQAVDCIQKVLSSCAAPDEAEPMQMAVAEVETKAVALPDFSQSIADMATKQAQEFITSLTGKVF